ncbi:uncharacterized protein LOC121386932 [Gigantopelta aegis]|uniref:uncharacterized protein LOC121386932 n=1 Tax=Gigantopelta aegis TaxID=1735272 RepID=UPI001B88D779|nr:uncharacterized protein LOC121386932 [Gigantopelta aegis]
MEARVIFSKKAKHRNGYLEEFPTTEKDYEGEYSDEDDVFVEDPILDIAGATKPLMHPRKRTKVTSRTPECKCRVLFRPILYFLLLVIALGGLMLLILYLMDKYKHHSDSSSGNLYDANGLLSSSVIGCDTIEVEDVWVVGIPKLLTESALRLVDVNQDGTLDVILGFATGADGYGIPDVVCDIYFNGTRPCLGGLIALEGVTGRELWRHYTEHELYAINCNVDLNGDKVKDCLAGGRAGVFEAVSGKDGKMIWRFDDEDARNSIMNLYTAQLIPDVDGDGVPDVIAVHGGDPLQDPGSAYRLAGRIVMFSGKTGAVLQWVGVPDKRESYYSPQVYTQLDGTAVVLFGTGGETHPGALWRISLEHLLKGQIEKAKKIHSDSHKGVMTPPVLVDITGDHVVDIILPMFNSSVIAVDGRTFQLLWNYSFPMSESYNTPAAGYYNDDDVPDFMVKFSHGPGFPVYYDSQTTVLDGRTGTPLITPFIRDTVGTQSSPLTISMEGYGNDVFLHWVADCEQHEGEGGEFTFVKGTNVHEQSRSDFCHLRFKTNGFSKMFATGRNFRSPGVAVYYSGDRVEVEKSVWINTTEEAIDFVRKHPEHLENYQYYASLSARAEEQKPYNKFKTADTTTSQHHGGEFISKDAHYRNQMTSSNSKKGPSFQQRFPNPSRDRTLGSLSRIPIDRDPIGSRRRPDLWGGSRQRPLDRSGWPDSTAGYEDRTDYGRDDAYPNANNHYWYNLPATQVQNNPYYDPPTDEYEGEEEKYNRYPTYKYSQKRSNASQKDKSKMHYYHMKHKRSVGGAEEYSKLFSKRSLDSLRKRLVEEMDRRRKEDRKRHKMFFMKRRKRESERQSENDVEGNEKIKSFHRDRRHAGSHDNPTEKTNLLYRHRRHVGFHGNPTENINLLDRHRRHVGSHGNPTEKNDILGRDRRHVGPHDNHGLQRLLSTGTIAPTTLPPDHADFNHSVDIIFATYWFFPAKTQAILPQDRKCISDKLSKAETRFDPKSKYYGLDEDSYEHTVTQECLKASDHQLHDDGVYESQTSYNPYDVHMGQMTMYRLRIKCTCSNATLTKATNQGKRCAHILPYDQQQWPAYMGRNADSHWLPRNT